ncbi:MAG: GntR family transcriptional regulator [Tissierellia bacterium]|nr:GntR family transcriptional regulator [Tissierellia bacterium]
MVTDKFKKSMSKQVYLDLKEQILNSTLLPGERLIEMTIANEQNVSRTPVREALKQLEQEGLVSTFLRKGSIVSKISVGTALDMLEVRGALELLALKLMAESKAEKPPMQLKHQLNIMKNSLNSEDPSDFASAYGDWMSAIASNSKNQPLKNMLNEADMHLLRLIPISLMSKERPLEVIDELSEILDAVLKNDKIEIENKLRHHIERVKEEILKNVDYRNFRK